MQVIMATAEKQIVLDVNEDYDPEILDIIHLESEIILKSHELYTNPEMNILVYMIRKGLLTASTYRFRTLSSYAPYVEGTLERLAKDDFEIITISDLSRNIMYAIVTSNNTRTLITGRADSSRPIQDYLQNLQQTNKNTNEWLETAKQNV